MCRYDRYERDYESDDSTLVNEERYRRRSRRSAYRSPSEDSYSPRSSQYEQPLPKQGAGSERDGFGKATLAVGLLAALAGLFHLWNVKKREEREREERHRRREKFAKAKAARRREEERRDWQRQQYDECETPSEMLRIGYAPAEREEERRPRMIGEGPSNVGDRRDRAEARYEEDRRSRRGS